MSTTTSAPPPPAGPNRPPPLSPVAAAPSPPAGPNRPPPPTAEQIAAAAGQRQHPTPASGTGPATPAPPATQQAPATPAPIAATADPIPATPQPLPAALPARAPDTSIPPARVALEAGDFRARPDYDRGQRMTPAGPLMTVAVDARPHDSAAPAAADGILLPPARTMTPASAEAALNGIVTRAKAWVADFPHPVSGEAAATLDFFRGLIGRDRHIADAESYGQDRKPDDIETRSFTPPPEAQALALAREQASGVIAVYDRALAAAKLDLTNSDRAAVDALRRTLGLL